ncbi:hypothetical protein EST38_g4863 [Candolleomyces aberdarensis]|uniref:DNA mismatch repair protein MSH3 n=1 Tax=Candolleomyces aberdarensis TaxID=2316362 RepID=A0A4Q2DPA4_9AGAR|nr:hypothetical protein EST38_g4863 [Candolleomyces aberdarensis]
MSQRKQATISSFFSTSPNVSAGTKRASAHVDLTGDSDNEATRPPAKKSKNASETQPSSSSQILGSQSTPSAASGPILKKYGYTPGETSQTPKTAAQQERHEAFKRRLLLDNSTLLPKASVSNQESPGSDGEENGDPLDSNSESEDPEEQFKKLSEMFANKGKKSSNPKVSNAPQKRSKKVVEIGPSGKSYTPLELQVRQLKIDNPGTVLMIEVGYRYKFFGDDAKVADRELGMVSFPDRNYVVASIPTHRRDVHLKKLLAKGYRVGIVNQIETAALKKIGDNKSGPFERKLIHLYTAATFVDDLNSVDEVERYTPPPFMCLVEESKQNDIEKICISVISICPTTGDVVWDDFQDTNMRIELETRLAHIQPSEILLPTQGLTPQTAKMLTEFSGSSATGEKIRNEHFNKPMEYTVAFDYVSEFFTDKKRSGAASESFRSGQLMAEITDFPKGVVVALAHAIKHLSTFGIADAFLETRFFSKFATRAHMLLAANTLTNLEIYRNETDHSVNGSLIWILDRTKTKFGARLLRNWIGRPLIDTRVLQERVDAVEEIIESGSDKLLTLRGTLKSLPDLAKGLSRIQYGQCTPQELAILLPAFNKIGTAFDQENFTEPQDVGFKSPLLNQIIFSLPKVKEPVQSIMKDVHLKTAAEGKKDSLWTDFEKYPEISDTYMALQTIEIELKEELSAVRKQLRVPSLQWTTWGLDEYLVEVKKKEKRPIPDDWVLHSSTKFFARYYTPAVRIKLQEKAQYLERLEAAASAAFQSFLRDIAAAHYNVFREAVNKLAVADCLLSLAHVAMREGYVKPEFVDEDVLEIEDGKHPMVDELRSDPYIPNSVQLGDGTPRSKIITGPNMGGKSSCVRMIALIVIMAQIGSYVPAASVRMKLIDSVLTRMGASDDITRGRSTFMVEMSETNEILQTATQDSLVILDELGRGTSTFDGMAIADAVLRHLMQQKRCKTLFITHYPMVAADLEKTYPDDLENLHMQYRTDTRIDGSREITFLYQLTSGLAPESFGIECGRLAGLPDKLLQIASQRSDQMRREVDARVKWNK